MKYARLIILGILFLGCNGTPPPEPVGPLPSARQLNWQPLEYYGFLHFNMNTFTDREWGSGGEKPETFNPSALDTRQWARIAKEAGMKGLILTAKHHDGFCLWPSATTSHTVASSPWKNGQGDVLGELAEACREYGLKLGVYLSPWDRNNAAYGSPKYVEIFHNQLRELLTNYGSIFEVWFDGANGGHGYYGGANETRKIDNKTYYQWDKAEAIVRELQPEAVIFSDAGPDIRWVGNEEGWADSTNWSIMRRDEIYPGWPRYVELRSGHYDGTHWLPAEADVSIRPGWYYHPSEDHRVKSLEQLVDIYYKSVGRNANLLLNIPVDSRGLIHPTDSARLIQLRKQLDLDFRKELSREAELSATRIRGKEFGIANLTDGQQDTYWSVPDDEAGPVSVTVDFGTPKQFNRLRLQEAISLGQRAEEFNVEVLQDDQWIEIARETTIGYKRILRFPDTEASQLRLNILKSKGPICLSELAVYQAPNFLTPPVIQRNRSGWISIHVPDQQVEVMVTSSKSLADTTSFKYQEAFRVDGPVTISAWARDPESGKKTAVVDRSFDVEKSNWKILGAYGKDSTSIQAIDDQEATFWATPEVPGAEKALAVDLGKEYLLKGFSYWPMQERWAFGHIMEYSFHISSDGLRWKEVSAGEFANIINRPVEQKVSFSPVSARYIKLKAVKVSGDKDRAAFGEIGILTR